MHHTLSHLTCAAVVLSIVVAGVAVAPTGALAAGDAAASSAGSSAHAASPLPYRGAIGRIDRPIVRAALPRKRGGFATERFTVGSDAACKTPRIGAGSGEPAPRPDDFIVMLGFPRVAARRGADETEPMPFVVWAAAELQDRVREQANAAGDDVRLLAVLGTAGVSVTAAMEEQRSDYRLTVEYPDTVVLARDDREPITGPARLIVVSASERVPFDAAMHSCAAIARDDSVRPLICIDALFSDSLRRCGTSTRDLDPRVCHLVGGGRRMRFDEQCFPGSGASRHPSKCWGEPDALDFIALPCGTVMLEFDWTGILDAGGELKARRLSGSSALSRGARFDDGPIDIPGSEFLGAIPVPGRANDSPTGAFAPVERASGEQELMLAGVASQRESALLFYPRMKVAKLCTRGRRRGQACAGADGERVECECDEAEGGECDCRDLGAGEARYFECVGLPERDHMPCTRASHCWVGGHDNGACSGEPVCVPQGTVWKEGVDLKGPDCQRDEDCDAGQQCGYALFELRGREDLPDDRIAYLIAPGSRQRGVCAQNRELVCGGDAGPCVDNTGPCIGYRLEALGLAGDGDGGRSTPVPKGLFDQAVPAGVHLGRGRIVDRDEDDPLAGQVQPVPGFEYDDGAD